jgi:hypothetical protein
LQRGLVAMGDAGLAGAFEQNVTVSRVIRIQKRNILHENPL